LPTPTKTKRTILLLHGQLLTEPDMALTEAASPSGASCISPNNMDWILHIVPTNELKADVSNFVFFCGVQK